jgi:hypothetical protein
MARNRDPFSLALQTLRQLALEGAFAPDRPIIILDEARRLRLSTTPVREALAWLGGEGMIERAPNGGYTGLRQDATSVAGRYRLRFRLLAAALDEDDRPFADWAPPRAAGLDDLFATLVRLRGDDILWRAYERVSRQLAWLATAETEILPDFETEAQALHNALGERSRLLAALERFHAKLAFGAAAILIAARPSMASLERDDAP